MSTEQNSKQQGPVSGGRIKLAGHSYGIPTSEACRLVAGPADDAAAVVDATAAESSGLASRIPGAAN